MIAAVLISESVIDRGQFMPAAQQVTGKNHVTGVDEKPALSSLLDDLHILEDFAGDFNGEMSTAITMMGFMVVGHSKEVDEFLEITRGLPYCETKHTEIGIRCVVVTGSVCDWQRAIIHGTRWTLERSSLRTCFSAMYQLFCQKGLSYLFSDFKAVDRSGVLLLEHK